MKSSWFRRRPSDDEMREELVVHLAMRAEQDGSVCRRYVETPHRAVAGGGGAEVTARIDAILANGTGLRLTLSKRLVQAAVAVAVLSLTVPIVTGAIEVAAFAAGQLPAASAGGSPIDPELRFEVASVKPVADPSGTFGPFGLYIPTPQRFQFIEMTIDVFLRQALQKPDYRMIGAPGWIKTERYTIMAKAPAGTPPAAVTTLMVNLLKDRFQLATHMETRELPIFNLVMARTDGRLGPDLKATPPDCQAIIAERNTAAQAAAAGRGAPPPLPGMAGGPPPPDLNALLNGSTAPCGLGRFITGNVAASGRSMAQIVTMLSDFVGRPVIDKTGLTGLFDLALKFAPEGRHTGLIQQFPSAQTPPVDPDVPSLSAALQEQLGLKLESARGPVEVVVIDRFERPTPD